MKTSFFKPGATLELDKRPYELLRVIRNNLWQLEDLRTKEILNIPFEELQSLYCERRIHFIKPLDVAKPVLDPRFADQIPEEAKIRRQYVLAILDLPCTATVIKPVIEEVWARLKSPSVEPHPVTVLRWKRRYLSSGKSILSLGDNVKNRGNRKPRYPPAVIELVDKAIEEFYMTLERKSTEETFQHAVSKVKRENKQRPSNDLLPLPTRRLVSGNIQRISAYDRYAARYGKDAAKAKFRGVLGHRTTGYPLERVEIDHTLMDLMVVDDETFVPIGRPYLTAAIDDNTRAILGIHISFQPPSFVSVARCLKTCFLPKVGLRNTYPRIRSDWKPHGVMSELVVDNGPEFHSDALEIACATLGIEIHYADRKNGAFKGKIERFLGTFNRSLSHSAPGTTFSNIFERDDYDPVKHAVVRYKTLKEVAHLWVADCYHHRPHRGLGGVTPASLWDSLVDPTEIPLPDNPEELNAIMARPEKRCLTHKGIELDKLFYNSAELIELRMRCGDALDVDIRVDDENLGCIYVISPDRNQILHVKALKYDYANGLTRWQHQLCRRYAQRFLDSGDSADWQEAKERIGALIAAELGAKRGRSKKISARAARYRENQPPDVPEKPILESSSGSVPSAVDAESDAESNNSSSSAKVDKRSNLQDEYKPQNFAPRYRERSEKNDMEGKDESINGD